MSSIHMILEPAWKLINLHLPIFIEVVCYNKKIEFTEDELMTMNLDPEEEKERGLNKLCNIS